MFEPLMPSYEAAFTSPAVRFEDMSWPKRGERDSNMASEPDRERPIDGVKDGEHPSPEVTDIGRERAPRLANGTRAADLPEERMVVQGRLPGARYVRVVRPFAGELRRQAPGYLVATERVLEPSSPAGKAIETLRRVLIGRRIRSDLEIQERVGKLKGLAIFASDNISSSAYATEEVMRVLVLAGVGALALTMPITVAIVVVLAIVVASYRQVIRAYPNGGGSYVVAHDNMGALAGLTAAAALLTDYILTVAVSTAAGVAAITSAFPELFARRVLISVLVVVVMTVLNLRGIRESGSVFAAPTYVYVVAILGMLGLGLFRAATGTLPSYTA